MSRPNGIDYPTVYDLQHTVENTQFYKKQGGFMRIMMMPTWGATGTLGEPSAALNTAASKLYYYVVHGNSRNISYDKSDLMKAYMAYDAVVMVLEEAKRAYKCIKAADVKNRWVKNIVSGLGWNYDNLSENIVKFRQVINLAAVKLNQISLPNVFDIFECHRELFQWVFYDRPSGKPQFIANVSNCAWIYDDQNSELRAFTHGMLYPSEVGVNVTWDPNLQARTVADFEKLINYMINSIYDSTDIGVIQGDLKRVFSEGQMIDVELLHDDEELPITHSLEYLLTIHNAEIWNYAQEYTTTTVSPLGTARQPDYSIAVMRDTDIVDGNLRFGIKVGTTNPNNGSRWNPMGTQHVMDLIDEWSEDEDAVLLMQKFKHNLHMESGFKPHVNSPVADEFYAAVPTSIGPALIMGLKYYYDVDALNYVTYNNYEVIDSNSTLEDMAKLTKLYELGITFLIFPSWFDDNKYKQLPLTWEVENVTTYSNDVLNAILNTMVESLWYNPALYNLG